MKLKSLTFNGVVLFAGCYILIATICLLLLPHDFFLSWKLLETMQVKISSVMIAFFIQLVLKLDWRKIKKLRFRLLLFLLSCLFLGSVFSKGYPIIRIAYSYVFEQKSHGSIMKIERITNRSVESCLVVFTGNQHGLLLDVEKCIEGSELKMEKYMEINNLIIQIK